MCWILLLEQNAFPQNMQLIPWICFLSHCNFSTIHLTIHLNENTSEMTRSFQWIIEDISKNNQSYSLVFGLFLYQTEESMLSCGNVDLQCDYIYKWNFVDLKSHELSFIHLIYLKRWRKKEKPDDVSLTYHREHISHRSIREVFCERIFVHIHFTGNVDQFLLQHSWTYTQRRIYFSACTDRGPEENYDKICFWTLR